jgi:hypothetical protein
LSDSSLFNDRSFPRWQVSAFSPLNVSTAQLLAVLFIPRRVVSDLGAMKPEPNYGESGS